MGSQQNPWTLADISVLIRVDVRIRDLATAELASDNFRIADHSEIEKSQACFVVIASLPRNVWSIFRHGSVADLCIGDY